MHQTQGENSSSDSLRVLINMHRVLLENLWIEKDRSIRVDDLTCEPLKAMDSAKGRFGPNDHREAYAWGNMQIDLP